MARRVEEIQRVRRDIRGDGVNQTDHQLDDIDAYDEEYYDVGDYVPDETGLNTASGILALALIALAVYLVWAALH